MSNEVPPPIRVLQMLMGLWVAQMTGAAAKFGVADHIANGVTSSDDLARAVGADPATLYRLLRACATVGLFEETTPKQFANTPLGECLRTNVPGTVRDFVIAETAPGHWLPWGRLYDAVKSGRSLATEILGMDAWEYYAKNHEEALTFARGMGNLSALVSQDVVRLYDPSRFELIVDVGGSQGVLLNGLLNIAPNARGILFDRPEIISEVVPTERVKVVGGDFFDTIPAGGDLYLLKSILHDWPDDKCDAILRNVHRAARDGAHLLIVETILPDTPQPSPVTFMDLNMLVMLGGRERNVAEYRELLRSTGFALERVIPTGGMFGLLEARKV